MDEKAANAKKEEEKKVETGAKTPPENPPVKVSDPTNDAPDAPKSTVSEELKTEVNKLAEENISLKNKLDIVTKDFSDLKNQVSISKNMIIINSEAKDNFKAIAGKLVQSGLSVTDIKKDFPSLFNVKEVS